MAKSSDSGITVSTVLTIVFVVLKLTHVIDWRWVWVLSPLWIPLVVLLLVACVALLVALIVGTVIGIKRGLK